MTIHLRKVSEVCVERISACNDLKNRRSMANHISNAPISLRSKICYRSNQQFILMSKSYHRARRHSADVLSIAIGSPIVSIVTDLWRHLICNSRRA